MPATIYHRNVLLSQAEVVSAAGSEALAAAIAAGDVSTIFSTRLVNPNYTGNCATIERASDLGTQDIGFVDGFFDTASADAFVSATTGKITKWYDQMELITDMVESGTGPTYNGSNSDYNSLPTFDFLGATNGGLASTTTYSDTDVFNIDEGTLFLVCSHASSQAKNRPFSFYGGTTDNSVSTLLTESDSVYWDFGGIGGDDRINAVQPTDWDSKSPAGHVVEMWRQTSRDQTVVIDGTQLVTKATMTVSRTTGWNGTLYIGRNQQTINHFFGPIVEYITSKTDLGSTVRDALRAEVQSVWAI